MGEAERVSFDHIWPGSEAQYRARVDQQHPDRGERCSRALAQVSAEIVDGRGRCAECDAAIMALDGLGECSVAHLWNAGKTPSTIAFPFCRRCAVSPEAVSRLAQKMVAELTGKPRYRGQ